MRRNELKRELKIKSMEVKIMGYVITNDGIRMSYAEYIEMIKAEQN